MTALQGFSSPLMAALSPPTSPSCSVDALECVVHATGAGADACFYARRPATVASTENLRYWLNPSVRARPTIATCEITNLGAPLFSPTSAATLHLSASPLFADGRCFPTRCVVSVATSAQRLDGVSVRPVVLKEWSLCEPTRPTAAALTSSCAAVLPTYTAEVPLRTLYHVASLMGSPTTKVEDVRLYLQLRFTGCSDASDTHRIVAVRLRYEHLGPADEVLPMLQRRRTSVAAATTQASVNACAYGGALDGSTFVEEVEVTITSSSSSTASDEDEAPFKTPPPPLRAERLVRIPSKEEESEFDSPPHRSATKPRADASSSFDSDVLPTHQNLTRHSSDAINVHGHGMTELLRVERTLRLPPPPPPSGSTSQQQSADPPLPTRDGAPWPPRKTRTIVLAPSISPSLSSYASSSASSPSGFHSPLSSPGSEAGSTPLSNASTSCDAMNQTEGENVQAMLAATSASSVAEQHTQPPVQVEHRSANDVSHARGDLSLTSSSSSPPPRRRDASVDPIIPNSRESSWTRADPPEVFFTGAARGFAGLPSARVGAAVLWEATSLLGTAPWKLHSLQTSRQPSPAASRGSSRASSRERSSVAPTHEAPSAAAAVVAAAPAAAPAQPLGSASASFLPATSRRTPVLRASEMAERGQRPLPQDAASPSAETMANASCLSWWQSGDTSASAATTNTSTARSFPQWRTSLTGEGSAHVTPQLYPPRSTLSPASTSASSVLSSALPSAAMVMQGSTTNPPSAYVPRLCFRTATHGEVRAHLSARAGIPHSSATPSTQSAGPPPPPLPPSRNKDLWTKPAKGAVAPTQAQVVVAEYGSPAWAHGRRSSSTATAPAKVPPAASAPAEGRQTSTAPISVIPASWLESRKSLSGQPHRQEGVRRTTSRTAGQSEQHAPSATAPTVSNALRNAASPASSSPADASFAESAAAGKLPPPPPPSPPPPRSRVLFHRTIPSQDSSRSSSSSARQQSPPAVALTQRNDRDASAPALPLQETHYYPPHRTDDRRRDAHAAGHRGATRRSRSAPVSRPARPASPMLHPDLSGGNDGVHAFAVLKHHASRNGVGRRRLTIRPTASQLGAATAAAMDAFSVRFFVALEKTHGVAQLRDSLGFGVKGGNAGSACEVPILQGDAVEVWTGPQAFHSGVIHKEKVHRVECCVVIRCNRQLVTALEAETTEAVDTISRLLLTSR